MPVLSIRFGTTFAIVMSSLFIVSVVARAEQPESDGADLLRFIQQTYFSNREGFTRCRISYIYRSGTTDSVENAIAGKFSKLEKQQACLFLSHGHYFRYERRHDPTFTVGGDANVRRAEYELITLADGRQATVNVDAARGIGTAMPMSGDPIGNTALTPFDMTIMGPGEHSSPAKLIGRFLAQESDPIECRIVGSENVFSSPCLKMEIVRASGTKSLYFLGESQNYLPRKAVVHNSDGTMLRTVFVPKTEQSSNGSWLATHIVAIDKQNGRIPVMSIEVQEWEVDQESL